MVVVFNISIVFYSLRRKHKMCHQQYLCDKNTLARRQTNINLSMIYYVFNTRFERFHSLFGLLNISIVFALQNTHIAHIKPEHKHTQPHTICHRCQTAQLPSMLFQSHESDFFLWLILCFYLRFGRPFLTTFNHLCLLNFPFCTRFAWWRNRRKCSLLIQFPCIQSATN